MDDETSLDRAARDADAVTAERRSPSRDGVVIPPDPEGSR
jgi:hypothetical protein